MPKDYSEQITRIEVTRDGKDTVCLTFFSPYHYLHETQHVPIKDLEKYLNELIEC